MAGNRFSVTLRDLGPDEAARLRDRLAEVVRWGLPNYFDMRDLKARVLKKAYLSKGSRAVGQNGAQPPCPGCFSFR